MRGVTTTSNNPSQQRLREIVAGFTDRRILALGDMVADEYIIGRPGRLSREAPIPVLEWTGRYIVPGGGANLARNARTLGGEVAVAGVIGRDEPGGALRESLLAAGVGIVGLVEEQGRPTSTKTRVVGGSSQVVSQQIARIDRVVSTEINDAAKARIIDYLRRELPRFDALIISDYENGVINRDIIAAALPLAHEHGLTITVDAHGDLHRFQGITIATPNQDEAAATLGAPLRGDDDVCRGGADLVRSMRARGVLITRGSEGMTLVEADGACHHLPASQLSEVRDATGAGDTVSATVTLALTAGASLLEAAHLGNLAAGIVVRRLGAATTTRERLTDEIAKL
jgi:rfaE bifunctional protein kinase chain/domain